VVAEDEAGAEDEAEEVDGAEEPDEAEDGVDEPDEWEADDKGGPFEEAEAELAEPLTGWLWLALEDATGAGWAQLWEVPEPLCWVLQSPLLMVLLFFRTTTTWSLSLLPLSSEPPESLPPELEPDDEALETLSDGKAAGWALSEAESCGAVAKDWGCNWAAADTEDTGIAEEEEWAREAPKDGVLTTMVGLMTSAARRTQEGLPWGSHL
jgi:hypothetical protein